MATNIRKITIATHAKQHQHAHGQLVFALSGQLHLEVSDKKYLLDTGSGCLIPANVMHSFRADQPNNELLIVDVPEAWNERHNPHTLLNSAIPELFNCYRVFELDNGMRQLIEFCSVELANRDLDSTFRHHLVHLIVQALVSRLFADSQNAGKINSAKLDSFIEEHLAKPITVTALAEQFFISESQFYKCFLEQYSMTPKQYITAKKMTKAKVLLKATDKSIQELSFALGYQHQSCFTRSYKRFFGISPKSYRQQCA